MSSSRNLILLVLAGCNQLFGIKDTAPEPPAFYDGGIDAARGCPAPGAMPDSYSPYVHQVYLQDCSDYSSVPAGRAIAHCFDTGPSIHEGPVGQPLPAAGITLPGIVDYLTPRLSPDGQYMLVVITVSGTAAVHMLARQSDGSWLDGPSPGITIAGVLARLSTIGHAPTGDRVLVLDAGGVTEWERQGTTWQQLFVHEGPLPRPWAAASMTTDALRLMVTDNRTVTYTDRSDPMQLFGPPVPISGVPALDDLYLTDDCARVYVTGFGGLYYVEQN